MTKKKEITLQDLFNKMEELNANFTNRINHLSDCVRSFCENDNTEVKSIEIHDNVMITDKDYATIDADNVYVGGKPATQYNGEDIYRPYICVAYFKEARDIIREEQNVELLEIHALQSSTDGSYAEVGNPVPDSNGIYEWVRIKFKDANGNILSSRWVFYYDYGSASNCASNCAGDCGNFVRDDGSLRAGLFGSVASN